MTTQIFGGWRIPGPLGVRATSAVVPPARYYSPPKKPAFPNISRLEFFATANDRMMDSSKISQRGSSLCGPASLMYLLGKYRPAEYYRFVSELYELGRSRLGGLLIEPGEDCRKFNPVGKIAGADWVALGSIRDSENAIFDYDDVEDAFAGITLPGELADWLSAAGFGDVRNETNLYFTKSKSNFLEAIALANQGYEVCMLINADGIQSGASQRGIGQIFTTANHWVVLTKAFKTEDAAVDFRIFTWGDGNHPVPYDATTMSMKHWLQYYYGYVACKA